MVVNVKNTDYATARAPVITDRDEPDSESARARNMQYVPSNKNAWES